MSTRRLKANETCGTLPGPSQPAGRRRLGRRPGYLPSSYDAERTSRRRHDGHPAQTPFRRRGPAPDAGDRAALVGVRQLRHPVQGVRQPGVPRDPFEKIADAAQVHRYTGVAPRCRCTSRGTWSTTTASSPRTPPTSASRSARSTPTRSRTTTTSSAALTTPTRGPPQGVDHHLECVDVMDADRVARPEALAARRHQLPGPGRHRGRQDRLAEALQQIYAGSARGPAAAAGVQVLRALLLRDRRPGLGHLALHCLALGERRGRARHRPPRAGHQHRVHRRAAAAGRAARRVRLQLAASTPTTT
jgi:hypothetical protein